ncbi:RNA polymerase-binding protein RbpA [Leucobacter sp. UCMA 4100]|uniref:RNA polymerase-binding protein RbpA n=1 Tax=Leucobacter TaxID=55968 RepID=UPI001C228C2C|nr:MULTISPECIES: RNA polymerase-binding protein RbpA [Leucobacter]MDA3148286.1 RNA polymerase-binding protein RbpA [Leucobacter sp. UCMA 4100]
MAIGNNAIRGARVGSGPMGEKDYGIRAERTAISYWDAMGNETIRYFASDVSEDDIPEQIDSPQSGLPAGRDKNNPPVLEKPEPYKTHLAYVKERRTPEEAEELLEQALQKLRKRRGTA